MSLSRARIPLIPSHFMKRVDIMRMHVANSHAAKIEAVRVGSSLWYWFESKMR